MDIRLRQIISSKSAGTYFIVTDNSSVTELINENKMRLFFINSQKGPVNNLVQFATGDITGFENVFGKGTRLDEKKGNFSISTVEDALVAGPVAVINLRKFDDLKDITSIVGVNPNSASDVEKTTPFTKLYNINQFWTPNYKDMPDILTEESLLSFGNVGTSDFSIFIVKSQKYDTLTSEGDETIANTSLEIDDYPALNPEMLIKDTFVDVYVFNNTFDKATVTTNKYYGHLFNNEGELDLSRIDELVEISEAGFYNTFTGSLLPDLVSENNTEISIDTIINQDYLNSGLISYINTDLFEKDDLKLLDLISTDYHDFSMAIQTTIAKKSSVSSDYLLSHLIPLELTTAPVIYSTTDEIPTANILYNGVLKVDNEPRQFDADFSQGIRIGDEILSASLEPCTVLTMVNIDENIIRYTCSDNVLMYDVTGEELTYGQSNVIAKINSFISIGLAKPFKLISYKPRLEQFLDGTSTRQNEILDMIMSPGILKGLKGQTNIRYVVDTFKSFVENSYKYQYGLLMKNLDENNRFVRFIGAEPFVEDLEKSTNPLFKENPSSVFDWKYVGEGGNKIYSSKTMYKFSEGAEFCFFYGPHDIVRNIPRIITGKISNLFYNKTLAFDPLANETGYVDGLTELETKIDDEDRFYCEKVNWNPIIDFNGGNTIFGNKTAQKKQSAMQQIHISELLAFIKESLYNLSKGEAFKKSNYDDYLRVETTANNFMQSLVLAGAIDPNPIVICNASNNTEEMRKQKIKLVYVEFTPVDVSEKIIFDLTIN